MTAQFPHWTQTVSTGTKSSTIFRAIITNYALMQSKYRDAMLPYESMEGFIKGFSVTNRIVTGIILHDDIVKTASQHHNKLHATSHITATDMIPLATSTVAGLMSTTQYNKLKTVASNANYRPINVGRFTGTFNNPNFVSQTITLNYRPRYIKIFERGLVSQLTKVYEKIDGNAKIIVHQVSTLAHPTRTGSNIVINNTGFKAKWGCNSVGFVYYYLAMG